MLSRYLLSASLRDIHYCSCKLQVARHLLHVASCKLHADRRQCEDADDRVPLAVVLFRDRTDHEVRLEVRRQLPIASLASHVACCILPQDAQRGEWAGKGQPRRQTRRRGAVIVARRGGVERPPETLVVRADTCRLTGLRCTDRFVAAHRVTTPRAAPVPGLNPCQGAPVGMRMDMEKPRPHLR